MIQEARVERRPSAELRAGFQRRVNGVLFDEAFGPVRVRLGREPGPRRRSLDAGLEGPLYPDTPNRKALLLASLAI